MKRIIITLLFVSLLVYLSIPTITVDSIKTKLFAEKIIPEPKPEQEKELVRECGTLEADYKWMAKDSIKKDTVVIPRNVDINVTPDFFEKHVVIYADEEL